MVVITKKSAEQFYKAISITRRLLKTLFYVECISTNSSDDVDYKTISTNLKKCYNSIIWNTTSKKLPIDDLLNNIGNEFGIHYKILCEKALMSSHSYTHIAHYINDNMMGGKCKYITCGAFLNYIPRFYNKQLSTHQYTTEVRRAIELVIEKNKCEK